MRLEFSLNGRETSLDITDHALLLDVLRDDCGLTGTKGSCGVQVCGACTVLVDDEVVSSCCMLANDVSGRRVTTIEGLAASEDFAQLEHAFLEHAAMQCGFCTPGFLLTLWSMARAGRLDSDPAVLRHQLSGNLCRCTGYKAIVDAAVEVALRRGAS